MKIMIVPKKTAIYTESTQDRTTLHPTNTNQIEKLQQNPLQIHVSSHSEIISEQEQNQFLEVQQELIEIFSLEQIQAENERPKMKHQKRIEVANQFLLKQELERNKMLRLLYQTDIVVQDVKITLETTQMIPPRSKKYHDNNLLDLIFV